MKPQYKKKATHLISDLIPDKPEYTMLSARVPSDLFELANEYKLLQDCSWNELITACLTQFVEEMRQEDNKH